MLRRGRLRGDVSQLAHDNAMKRVIQAGRKASHVHAGHVNGNAIGPIAAHTMP